MVECNFCNKEFISALNLHKKTTKYCLKIQGKLEQSNIECEHCNKNFTANRNLLLHLVTCESYKLFIEKQKLDNEKHEQIQVLEETYEILSEKYKILENANNELNEKYKILENTNSELKEENKKIPLFEKDIAVLKAQIEIFKSDHERIYEIAKQPKQINNKYSMLIPLQYTPDQVTEKVQQNFTSNYFIKGQEGVADFTHDVLLVDSGSNNKKYVCTDPSRSIFNFKNEKGEIIKDMKADILTKMISKDVITKSNSIYEQSIIEKPEEKHINLERLRQIKKMSYDNTQFMNQIKILTCNNYNIRNNEEKLEESIEEIFDEQAERDELEQLKRYLSIEEYNNELQEIEQKYKT